MDADHDHHLQYRSFLRLLRSILIALANGKPRAWMLDTVIVIESDCREAMLPSKFSAQQRVRVAAFTTNSRTMLGNTHITR